MKQWALITETNEDDEEEVERYRPVGKTSKTLHPDLYECGTDFQGVYLVPLTFENTDIMRFKDSPIDEAVRDIEEFWRSRDRFYRFGFPFKHGIMMHGPAGSGKTSTIRLIVADVIQRGGIALKLDRVPEFEAAVQTIRSIEPDVAIVTVMEDLDQLVQRNNMSRLLNMLDGVNGFENIVYLATTNYPEELEERIINRPSRFDRVIEIGYPTSTMREQYLVYMARKDALTASRFAGDELKKWVKDTDGMTLAHLKDLFVSVFVYETKYKEALDRLVAMYDEVSSEQYKEEELPKVREKTNGMAQATD